MITFYWYPKCSTCKKAKAWLDEQGMSYQMIDMIQEPPAKNLIEQWMKENDWPIRRYFNTSGMRYREQNLKEIVNDLTPAQAAEKLSQDGMLIKRPILVVEQKVLLGFREAQYQELLLDKK